MKAGYLPKNLQNQFIDQAVYVNRILLRAFCIFAIIIQSFNIVRVVFLSNSGLGTTNNRIYFGFYTFLFIISAAYLLIDGLVKLQETQRYYLHMAVASIILLWNTGFNMYDIYHSGALGNITIVTTVVTFSALFVMRPVYAIGILAINYLPFVLFLWNFTSSGEVINFTITILICAVVFWVKYRHLCIELQQEQEIQQVHKELDEARHQSELTLEQYELIRDKAEYITFKWNIRDGGIHISKGWKEKFGLPDFFPNLEKVVDTAQALAPEQRRDIMNCMENVRNGVHRQKREYLLPLKTGEKRWFELLIVTQTDLSGEPAFAIGMLSDIMEQKERVLQLEQELQRDSFTDTLNKAAIEAYGERKIHELENDERMTMLILDMDDFKMINDVYGHPCGDKVLTKVAELLKELAPKEARVGRIGGDEFAVLMAAKTLDSMRQYAEEIVRLISFVECHCTDVRISCSIGIAASELTGDSYARLYKAADQALYEAKKQGKNCVVQADSLTRITVPSC